MKLLCCVLLIIVLAIIANSVLFKNKIKEGFREAVRCNIPEKPTSWPCCPKEFSDDSTGNKGWAINARDTKVSERKEQCKAQEINWAGKLPYASAVAPPCLLTTEPCTMEDINTLKVSAGTLEMTSLPSYRKGGGWRCRTWARNSQPGESGNTCREHQCKESTIILPDGKWEPCKDDPTSFCTKRMQLREHDSNKRRDECRASHQGSFGNDPAPTVAPTTTPIETNMAPIETTMAPIETTMAPIETPTTEAPSVVRTAEYCSSIFKPEGWDNYGTKLTDNLNGNWEIKTSYIDRRKTECKEQIATEDTFINESITNKIKDMFSNLKAKIKVGDTAESITCEDDRGSKTCPWN
jgi:hypothetical protein